MWSVNQQTTNQRHGSRRDVINMKIVELIRDVSRVNEAKQLTRFLSSLSLSLKVAKSPNLRRLSRDLLLEILDAIADYLKDCNIAVSSWWDGIFQLRGNEEFVSVKKDGICSHLKWTFGHWNLPLPTPIVYWRKDDWTQWEADRDWISIESWSWNLTPETAVNFIQCANEAERNTEANVPHVFRSDSQPSYRHCRFKNVN